MSSEGQIFLRALDKEDLQRTHRWHNDPDLYSTLVNPFRYVSSAAEADWLQRKTAYSVTEVNLAICLRSNGEHIGNLYLGQIDWISRRAFLGIFIGALEHRGKGYGRQAMRLALMHAFKDLNLQRVFLEVLPENTGAIKLYEKCGFVIEGRLRKHAFKNGRYQDVVLMGINQDEFK